MFDDEFDIALYRVALVLPEWELDELGLDDPDLMDIEGLCVSWDEYDEDVYDTVPRSLSFE